MLIDVKKARVNRHRAFFSRSQRSAVSAQCAGFLSFAGLPPCLRSGLARDSGFGTTCNGADDTSPRVEVEAEGALVVGKGAFGETNCTNTSPSLTMPIS